jgi:hypothetical protein
LVRDSAVERAKRYCGRALQPSSSVMPSKSKTAHRP